jgi:hypothetical protein
VSVVSLSSSLRIVFVLLLLSAAATHAQTAPDLYRTSVPVSEQSPAELKRAAPIGLAEVLGRVSGRDDVAQQAALGEPLTNADRYIEQYRYQKAEDGSLQLQLQFSPATINGLLRGAGLLAKSTNRQGLQLRVSGIENFADYAALLGYLGGIGSVRAAPELIEGDVVTLSLSIAGGSEHLVQQLATDRRLLPAAVASDPAAPATLGYQWQGRGG